MDLFLLFIVSLLAATLLPGGSEMLLAGLYMTGDYGAALLIMVATVGNVLGSIINWLLCRYLIQFKDRKWFPVKADMLQKATHIYQRFGVWSLLFAWLPFMGDPLTVIAGLLRTHIVLFVTLVAIGKAGRYIAVVAAL